MATNPLCEKYGHMWSIVNLLGGDVNADGEPINVVRAQEDDQFPHLWCARCEHVHIVIDVEYDTYAAAVAALAAIVKKAADAKPKRQARREERQAAAKAERDRQKAAAALPPGTPVAGAPGSAAP